MTATAGPPRATLPALTWSSTQLAKAANALQTRDRHGDTITDRIHAALEGHPRAARWDTGATANRPWCWTHQRDVIDCQRANLDCLADDLVGTNDPAGDLAAHAADRRLADQASEDLQLIEALTRTITAKTEELLDVLERWPAPHPASAYERSISADNTPGCDSCARVRLDDGRPMWSQPKLNGSGNPYRTDKAGLLPKPMILCQGCDGHVTMTGVLPPKKELERLAKGQKRNCTCEPRREVWTSNEGAA